MRVSFYSYCNQSTLPVKPLSYIIIYSTFCNTLLLVRGGGGVAGAGNPGE